MFFAVVTDTTYMTTATAPRTAASHEWAARHRKAATIVEFITTNAPEFATVATVEAMTAEQWAQVAEWAGVRTPSATTVAEVVRRFRKAAK